MNIPLWLFENISIDKMSIVADKQELPKENDYFIVNNKYTLLVNNNTTSNNSIINIKSNLEMKSIKILFISLLLAFKKWKYINSQDISIYIPFTYLDNLNILNIKNSKKEYFDALYYWILRNNFFIYYNEQWDLTSETIHEKVTYNKANNKRGITFVYKKEKLERFFHIKWWYTKYYLSEIWKLKFSYSIKLYIYLIKNYINNKWCLNISLDNFLKIILAKISEKKKKYLWDKKDYFLSNIFNKILKDFENLQVITINSYEFSKNKDKTDLILKLNYTFNKKIADEIVNVPKTLTLPKEDIIDDIKTTFINNDLENLFNWDIFYQALNEWYFKELLSDNKENIVIDYIKALIEIAKEDNLDWSFIYWKLLTAKNDISLYEKTWINDFKQLLQFLKLLNNFEKFSIQEKTKIIKMLNKNNRDEEYLEKIIEFINNNDRVENKKAYLITMLTNNSEASELKKKSNTPKNFLKKENNFEENFKINTVKI